MSPDDEGHLTAPRVDEAGPAGVQSDVVSILTAQAHRRVLKRRLSSILQHYTQWENTFKTRGGCVYTLNDWFVTIHYTRWSRLDTTLKVSLPISFYYLIKCLLCSMRNSYLNIAVRSISEFKNTRKTSQIEHVPFRCTDSMSGRSSGWMQVSNDEPIRSWGRYPSNGTALHTATNQFHQYTANYKSSVETNCACAYWPVVHFEKDTARGVSGGEDALVQRDPRCCRIE